MPKRKKLVLVPNPLEDRTYKVKETHNMLTPLPGKMILEHQVRDFMREKNIQVVIKDK
jgi:hypothetical protein